MAESRGLRARWHGKLLPVRRVLATSLVVAVLVVGAVVVDTAARGSAEPVPVPVPAPAARTVPAEPAGGVAAPLLAVVGASFSAGTGAGEPANAWPQQLARLEGWRVVVSADPGAGYVNHGLGHRGPFSALAARLDLPHLRPTLVIVQGGHDDIGQPPVVVSAKVTSLLTSLRRAAPQARLGVLSVFSGKAGPSAAAIQLDRAIVEAARHVDPAVLVLDPLQEHWTFARSADGLHPSATGHRWIAERVAADLARAGVHAATSAPRTTSARADA